MVDKRTENVNLALDNVRQMLNTVSHGSITLIVQNFTWFRLKKGKNKASIILKI